MGNFRKLIRWNTTAGGLFYPEELAVMERMSLRDKCHVADGSLAIYEFPADDLGQPIREKGRLLCLGDNLIVNWGRHALAYLQRHTAVEGAVYPGVGGGAGIHDLGYLAVGDGSGGGAVVPQPTDTALASELTGGPVPRPLLSVTTPPPGPPYMVNLWSGQIGTSQLNGETINEAAMFCLDDSTMFNYRTFANQAKSAGFVMEFRWTIIF